MERREFLVMSGTALSTVALAGCSGDEGPDDTANMGDGGNGGNESDTGGGGNSSDDSDGGDGADGGGSDLQINEHELYEEDFSAGVEGVVENTADEAKDYVEVRAEFFNADGTKLEDGLDNTQNLDAGGTWQFDCMYPGTDPDEIDDYEIEVSDSPF